MADRTGERATSTDAYTARWVPEWLSRQAAARPDGSALVAGPRRWSFKELDRQAVGMARQLAGCGVAKGSRVAVLLRNGAPSVVLTHALLRLSAIMVPLNIRLSIPEMIWQLADSNAAVLVTESQMVPLAEEVASARASLRCIAIDDPPGRDVISEAGVGPPDAIELAAVQGIVYTSATAGRPKGVLLTHGNHWWSAVGSALRLGIRDNDRWLALLPFYHVGGLAMIWRSVIYGIPLVVHDAFDPRTANDEIDSGGITLVSVVPTMLERLLEARGAKPFPPSLRCVLLGGGPAPASLITACIARSVPVAPTYGLTEAASQVATLPPDAIRHKPGSCGPALLPTQVRIDQNGRMAAPGEVGEIIVRGPTVMRGYAGRPDETAQALREGWLHTGDLGYLDEDGYLYIVDRRDDLIITGGENVYPAEVETVLLEHPAVADAGVIGLPDPTWGQVVAAFLVARPGERPEEGEIKAFCAGRLASYKVPRRLSFLDSLPRSGGGKLLRRQLREWAAHGRGIERA